MERVHKKGGFAKHPRSSTHWNGNLGAHGMSSTASGWLSVAQRSMLVLLSNGELVIFAFSKLIWMGIVCLFFEICVSKMHTFSRKMQTFWIKSEEIMYTFWMNFEKIQIRVAKKLAFPHHWKRLNFLECKLNFEKNANFLNEFEIRDNFWISTKFGVCKSDDSRLKKATWAPYSEMPNQKFSAEMLCSSWENHEKSRAWKSGKI